MTASPRLLDACARRPLDRPPVWLMRQAGRYLPEYRAVRERAGGFWALASTPELAAEVTLQPIRRFYLDAAIVFSDILVAARAMGAEVSFDAGEGPRVRAHLERLHEPDPREACPFVYETLRIVRAELKPETALLGFAGAPFTLACYLVEGETTRGFERARAFFAAEPARGRRLLERIARFTARHLAAQVEAGAHAVQLFDSWAHLLAPEDAREIAFRAARETIEAFWAELSAARLAPAPAIYYGPPAPEVGASAWSIDWRQDLAAARRALPVVQGNLDPAALLAGPEATRARTRAMLARAGGAPGYIANLGHGVLKDTPIESVEAFVEEVRACRT